MSERGHFDPRPHVVYRCYSADGELLYIGCSVDLGARLRQHSAKSAWWTQVERVQADGYKNGWGGRWAEKFAIQRHQPTHNRACKTWRNDWTNAGVKAVELRRTDLDRTIQVGVRAEVSETSP